MIRRVVVLAVLGLLAVVGAIVWVSDADPGSRQLVATFPRTTSLYEGANVKVLGVDVGRVDKIEVKGTSVEATISYDDDVLLPADVHALIVPPSIVGDRFVQLAPAYAKGDPVLADDARLDLDHTAIPLELDDTYRGLDKIASALGPQGANSDGSLSRLISAAADSVSGNGRQFNTTVRELAAAMSTLAGSSDDITGTVRNLSTITHTFAGKDDEMRALVMTLAAVSAQLDGQRDAISGSVKGLRQALRLVADFTADNRGELTRTVKGLTSVAGMLTRRTDQLEELADLAPVGLTSMMNIHLPKNWDPRHPERTPVAGRQSVQMLRGALFDDLDIQLGYTLSAVCAQLPPDQRLQLAGFCDALEAAGGSLGAVLTQVIKGGLTGSLLSTPGPSSLSALLSGGQG
jgi:phospholipid/cholesterol/gamma-HCH transport system substrate-binding protein